MVAFVCPKCRTTSWLADESAGEPIRCPICNCCSASDRTAASADALATVPPAAAVRPDETAPPCPLPESATLPPSSSPETATLLPAPSRTSAEAATPPDSVPGYEILGELGRGGMGVVYQARQVGLNRLCALKMILAGGHAGASDLARFKTEAEAIARLQHANIVGVYEVGEHQGKPFFSLEFCPGGNLDRKLAGTPLDPKEAARLVEALARAMHAAHGANVIHRDLKPANVLLAADGTPKITDFGLAKKLDESGQTQTGQIMGTPSYMAPEQAEGKKEIGPAADVYALGAILYECLTGRPPFKAATSFDTLLQVVSEEPAPPRQLNARAPVDLETISLKCLQKNPARRYPSAADLADELERFLAGKPIKARPVGRLERGWKWVRRNPVVAAMSGALVLALLAGIGVSTAFALAAMAARDELKESNKELTASRDDLKQSNDRLLTSIASSLLRPLALQVQSGQPVPGLSDPEIEALWELASTPEEPLRLRFVEEALRAPAQTRQLRDRGPFALQSAVGLDAGRRARVEATLGERLWAKGTRAEQKVDLALTLAHWGIHDQVLARQAAAVLLQAMKKTASPLALRQLAQGLAAVAADLEAKEAATLFAQAMSKTRDSGVLQALAQGLLRVAARLPAKEAATLLLQAMNKPPNPYIVPALGKGLAAAAARLDAKEAKDVATLLGQTMSETTDAFTVEPLAKGLAAVAGRLEGKEAEDVALLILQTMSKRTYPFVLQALAEALSVVEGLEPTEAVRVRSSAAILIVQAMNKTPSPHALGLLAQGLSAVAARLEAKEATRPCSEAATLIVQAMKKTASSFALQPQVRVGGREREAAMKMAASSFALQRLAQGLAVVAAGLDAKEATRPCSEVATLIVQAMKNTASSIALQHLAQGLSAVAARLEAKEASRLCSPAAITLAGAMSKTTNTNAMGQLAEGLSAVAARLEAKEASRLCGPAAITLAGAISKTTDPRALGLLAQGLSAAAARLEAKEASRLCGPAATLAQAMSRTTDPSSLVQLAAGLSALLAREEPAALRTRLAAAITAFASPSTSPTAPLAAPALLLPALAAPPHPLPAQMLVDLLKNPFCVGEVRRLVLDQLQRHYQRPFADQWDFVRFATEQKLNLDLTSPPQPPGAVGALTSRVAHPLSRSPDRPSPRATRR